MSFIGRESELAFLDEQYQHERTPFVIVYGRRRVGKTRLLTHWLESRQLTGFYWVGTQASTADLLASFSAIVYKNITGQNAERGFSYHDWEDALEQLAQAIEKRTTRTVVIMDEFAYIMDADAVVASILQKMWDHRFKTLPVMLVLSGSHVGMMERDVISYRAPLYGRGTGRLHLRELPFKEVIKFFPKYSVEERVTVYAILGGIPFYLEQFNPAWKISENIKRRVMEGVNLLQEEPRLLMHEQIQEPRQYISILLSIAHGNTSTAEIALDLGIDRTGVNKYLTTMLDLGLVSRDIPATERHPDRSRRGRYHIKDAYLRFYFRFIHPRLSEIAMKMVTDVIENIKEHLIEYVGKYAFEDLCRQWVIIAGASNLLPFHPEVTGGHWSAKEEIDIVAVNWRSHHILFGECKWGASKPLEVEVVTKLRQQAAKVIPSSPKGKPFQDHYIFFSRAGFTEEAHAEIKRINGIAVDLQEFERVLNLAVI